ncbi:MAG: SAM-dependent methyltransferase, partial [Bacillota bacterium]|nr:SAM-dependent methyltransferase [Bacillota bacterium]
HRNIPYFEGIDFALQLIRDDFKQINILTVEEDIQILASKPSKPRITAKAANRKAISLAHDRQKNYIIEDGKPCDFLIELGVMSPEGKVYKNYYSKFRQINRFLEIADNCFLEMPKEGTIRVVDFGCGKSYLTFALYYYLKLIRRRDVEIIGLDLKEDVIDFCNETARKLGYDELKFLVGDIADYDSDGADMVVTLHACDTATDYALINAVKWHSRIILSVPCCQHELFSQITEETNNPMLKHGIIKDKFTELLTDALRGLKLEAAGYSVDMIEFTSLEHTSKNIMIRAVASPKVDRTKASREYEALKDFYSVKPTIDLLETYLKSK